MCLCRRCQQNASVDLDETAIFHDPYASEDDVIDDIAIENAMLALIQSPGAVQPTIPVTPSPRP